MVPEGKLINLKALYESVGQGHVFTGIESLPKDKYESFIELLDSIDVVELVNNFKRATGSANSSISNKLEPLDESEFDSVENSSPEVVDKWYKEGLSRIAMNQVATIVMAGGQGTRLGSSQPKGCYNVGLPSQKSLFQVQTERIISLQRAAALHLGVDPASVKIQYLVMTSLATRADTQNFFESNLYFGLDADQVYFFDQGSVPSFTFEGKLILESIGKLSMSPDGNGGMYHGLISSNILNSLRTKGVKYFHAYSVDNILVRVADPWFIGYSALRGSESGALVLSKQSWDEKVGVICKRNSRYEVLEYSEIPEELAKMTRPDGSLYYSAANICNHFYTMDFFDKYVVFRNELQYHIAEKKIKFFDFDSNTTVTPKTPNGIKLERFIFDVFPFCKNLSILSVTRNESFSPLKNAPGSASDCPETSRADLVALHVKFAENAGAIVLGDARNNFEISPVISYFGEGLEFLNGKVFSESTIISTTSL